MYNEVFFDVETQRLFNETKSGKAEELGISVVSAYKRTLSENFQELKGTMQSYWEKDLESLWEWFQSADRVVGFNSTRFDIPVLQPYTKLPLHKYNHFDILEKVKETFGKRISLNDLAKDTLGSNKTDVGTNAVIYWQKGDPQSLKKLQSYCEADVALTKDLYDYALKNNHLKFTDKWNTPRTIEVNFSYPASEPQIGLF